MQRHGTRNCILAALPGVLLVLTGFVLAQVAPQPASAQPTPANVSATVGSTPTGQPLPSGFVGLSLEYSALSSYAGRNPKAVNPVLIHLIRNLAPGQRPILRIGGDSTDSTWWPIHGWKRPAGIDYTLTSGWLNVAKTVAGALGARMIMGINLAADLPKLAAAEGQALVAGIGRRYIEAFEIGNEPDVYGMFPWYQTKHGRDVYSRPGSYDLSEYVDQFSRWRTALPSLPLAGPAFAELNWLGGLPQFIDAEQGLRIVTLHRYPLRACLTDPSAPGYPTIASLLSDQASAGIAQAVAPYVGTAHAHGLSFRVDEMNSASCSGKFGVSNTFASALWVLDTLFNLADAGVDGVNIHSLPGAAYAPFWFTHRRGRWEAFVRPEYYGMLLFAQAFPPGAKLLPVSVSPSGPLKVWATRDSAGHVRVVVINKDPANAYDVSLQVPGLNGEAQLERLQAPSAASTNGVTLGGQTFGNQTSTGDLPALPHTDPLLPVLGSYSFLMPAASAALLTP